MGFELINIGTIANDLTGDTPRAAGQKINNNLNGLHVASIKAENKAGLEALSMPATAEYVEIAGYRSAGDGGSGSYKRVASEPSHAGKIQSSDGAWWEFVRAGGHINVCAFGAVGDGVDVTGTTTISNGSSTLVCASASFTAADVGKAILVPGAGGSSVDLVTTIASFVSVTTVTLTASATSSVSGTAKVIYGTDCATAINAALALAIETGGSVFFPPGSFFTSTDLSVSWAETIDDVPNRLTIQGCGSGVTHIDYAGTGTALSILGPSADYLDFVNVSGLRLNSIRSSKVNQVGLLLARVSWSKLLDVAITQFSYGLLGYDVPSIDVISCNIRYNSYGVTLQRQTLSNPNNVAFIATEIAHNEQYGLSASDCTTIVILAGAIENNARYSSGAGYGVAFNNDNSGTLEGAVAASIYGVYFEGNGGVADVLFRAGATDGNTALKVDGCTFNRISGTSGQYVTNNIKMNGGAVTSAKIVLTVTGCGFQHFGSYTPNASRKYIDASSSGAKWVFSDGGGSNMYASDTETPALTGPNKTGVGIPTVLGLINGTAASVIYNMTNISSVTRNGVGDYTVTFERALASTAYIAHFNLGAPGVATVFSPTAGSLRFQTWDMAGVSMDSSYIGIAIYGG